MNHIVCIAYVPDTETKIRIAARRRLDRRGRRQVDRLAVRRVRARGGAQDEGSEGRHRHGGHVRPRARRHGPARVPRPRRRRGGPRRLRRARPGGLARRGAPPRRRRSRTLPHDVVWMGNKGVGTDAQVLVPDAGRAPRPAAREPRDEARVEGRHGATAHREIEGAQEVVEMPLPGVIGATKGLNEPRYASLKGIMAAKKKTIAVKTPADARRRPGDDLRRRRARALDEAGAAARRGRP